MDAPHAVNAADPDGRARRAALRHHLLLLLAGAALFLWRLGAHDLWPPDEPRFALVAREMWDRQDYVVLSLNNRLYTDKPPLFFWAINAAGRLRGGVDEWSARLPSALAGLGTLLLVYRLGAGLYDRRAALLGALVYATCMQIAERARWASIDMTLHLFVLGAILLLVHSRERPERGPVSVRLAWILMGLGTLAKGPVGLILPLLAVVPGWLLEKDGRAVRRVFAPSGIALYLLVTLAWFGPFAARVGVDDALRVLARQNVERYLDAWNARHPIWYYLWRFPIGFLPWSLVLPWAIVQAWRERSERARRAARFLLAWSAAILLFFSFSTGKRGVYVIPVYPAAALLVGRLLATATRDDRFPDEGGEDEGSAVARRRLAAPVVLWTAAALLVAVALPLAARRRDPALVPVAAAIAGVLLVGGAGALVGLRRRGGQAGAGAGGSPAAAWCLVGSAALVVPIVVGGVVPWINRFQNIRGFAEQVRPHLDPGVPFGTTEQKREAWVFYTGRFAEVLDTRDSLLAYVGGIPPRDLLIEEEMLQQVRQVLPSRTVEVVRGRVGGSNYYLMRRAASQ